jgi:hypothetical protein
MSVALVPKQPVTNVVFPGTHQKSQAQWFQSQPSGREIRRELLPTISLSLHRTT